MLEHGYRTRVQRAHRLPPGRRQVRATGSTGVVYRDTEYDGGLVVELDGRLVHNTVSQRDLDAALDGRVTVRLSWGQVIGRPCDTAATIAHLLRQRGWAGHPQPCSPSCPIARTAADPTHHVRRIHRDPVTRVLRV